MDKGSRLINYSKIHLFGIQMAFIELKDYNSAIEAFLENETKQLEGKFFSANTNKIEENSLEYNSEFAHFLETQYSERHFELSVVYPHNFRASFLTQIISFVEYELRKICDSHQLSNKVVFGVSDLSGNSDFEKCRKYLHKVCNVDFNRLVYEWSFIDNARLLRNKIIHQQGVISITDGQFNKLNSFIRNQDGLAFKEDTTTHRDTKLPELSVLITTRNFCENLLVVVEAFFTKLLTEELEVM